MLPRLLNTPARVALALAILISLPMSLRQIARPDQPDFQVYLTAAELVREHRSLDIYNEADTGRDPQLAFASSHSIFLQAAVQKGISGVRLYVYPPTLADALVPLAFLSLRQACNVWLAINLIALVLTAAFFTRLLGKPLRSPTFLWMLLAVLFFRANIWAMYWGQISIVLLLLWSAGIALYVEGHRRASAVLLAIATAIKLTPLLVLLPFLIWREWKWTRWFALSLVACAAAIALINGPPTILDYTRHVLPAMSAGIPSVQNISLPAAIELLYGGLHGADANQVSITVPHIAVMIGKAAALIVLLAAIFLMFRLRNIQDVMLRAKILAMIALLSICIAPVSWRHAYCIAFPALFFSWKDALERRTLGPALVFLTICTIEFAFVFDSVLTKITHGVALASVALLAPCYGIALIFLTLGQMTDETPAAASNM